MHDIVQAHYEQLEQIAGIFGSQAEAIEQMYGSIQSTYMPLEKGEWRGEGSLAFFNTMNAALFPALQRLTTALQQAQTLTRDVSKTLRDAEEEASKVFDGDVMTIAASNGGGPAFAPSGAISASTPSGSSAMEEQTSTSNQQDDKSWTESLFDFINDWMLGIVKKMPPEQLAAYDKAHGIVSPEKATEIFNDMADEEDIPFNFPDDGCYARAHEMAYRIAGEPYFIDINNIDKVFITGDLEAKTDNVYDKITYPGGYVDNSSTKDGTVNWGWHVAPIIKVRQTDGSVVPMVIDPSLADKPITIQEWQDIMGDPNAKTDTKDHTTYGIYYDNFGNKNYLTYSEDQKLNKDAESREVLDLYWTQCSDAGYCGPIPQEKRRIN